MKVLITITPEEIASSVALHNNSEEFVRVVFGYDAWKHTMSRRKQLAYAIGKDINVNQTITDSRTGLSLDIMIVINKNSGLRLAFDTDLIDIHGVLNELYKRPVEVKSRLEELSEGMIRSKKIRKAVKQLRKTLKRFLDK